MWVSVSSIKVKNGRKVEPSYSRPSGPSSCSSSSSCSTGWGVCEDWLLEMRRGKEGAGCRLFDGARAGGAAKGGL